MTVDSKDVKISKRGFVVQGVVVSDRRKKTVTVQRDLVSYVPKYKRYARKISKIAAHNPDEIGARIGDVVEVAECRKISKTKAWIVTRIIRKGPGHIIPGQVKARDEAQAAHQRKHGGGSQRGTKEKAHRKTQNEEKVADAKNLKSETQEKKELGSEE